jgi:hypothetical protein
MKRHGSRGEIGSCLTKMPQPPGRESSDEDQLRWKQIAVRQFCERHRLASHLANRMIGEQINEDAEAY